MYDEVALSLGKEPGTHCEPQSRSGCLGENKGFLPLPGIKPRSSGRPTPSLVTTKATLMQVQLAYLYYICVFIPVNG